MTQYDNMKGLTELIIGACLLIVGLLCLVTGCVIGTETGRSQMQKQMQHEAIDHGYAEYSSQTGKWQWKGEVSK
jgi:hypothetical protein